MSDVFQGPGSWMASDGKWYPAEYHPDLAYRQRFAPVAEEPALSPQPVVQIDQVAESPVHEQTTQHSVDPEPALAEPMSALASDQTPPAHVATNPAPAAMHETAEHAVAHLPTNAVAAPYAAETAELSATQLDAEMAAVVEQRATHADQAAAHQRDPVPDVAWPAPPPTAPTPEPADPSVVVEPARAEPTPFSVASTTVPSLPPADQERPTFAPSRPASVVEPPAQQSVGRTQVELGRPPEEPKKPGLTVSAAPPEAYTSRSTAIEPYVGPSLSTPTTRDRIISSVLFLGGVALIVGSFLNWTIGEVVETGWQRGDGIVTMVSGVIGSAMAGPIFVGFRHVLPKAIAIVVGVASVIALGLVAVNSVLGPTASGVDFGIGFFVTLLGAGLMIAGGAADKGELDY